MNGIVFDIQRYSLSDGPGIRTTVFLKGCPLRCRWCANPESQSAAPELAWFRTKCVRCGRCERVCPRGAIRLTDEGVAIDRALCDGCGACADRCEGGALKLYGRSMSAEAVMAVVRKDFDYYRFSGGGMTLSGGDVASQPEFAAELLSLAREGGIDAAVETCAALPPEQFLPIARLAGGIYADLKLVDSALHERFAGGPNAHILENIRRMRREGLPLTVRTPLVPGVNTSAERVAEAAEFLLSCGIGSLELLPYHRLGASKYAALGREYALEPLPGMRADEAREVARLYEGAGIAAHIIA